MKKTIGSLLILLIAFSAGAQSDSLLAPYKRFPTVPPIRLLLADSSTILTKDMLPKKKAVLVMIFSPDCDHCKHETEEIIKQIDKFKKVEIVMATFLPFDKMKEFYTHYDLKRFKNIQVGRDFTFLLPSFYNFRSFPFFAFYDKKGDLIEAFEGTLPIDKLTDKFD
jgi:thioredoxin-related protein